MSFINISAIRTADPGNVWVPKNSFFSGDAFAIVMDIQVDSSVIQAGLLFDAVRQIVNPRQDPYSHAWWTFTRSDVLPMPTIDVDWTGVAFQWGTNFSIWHWWSHYSDAVKKVTNVTWAFASTLSWTELTVPWKLEAVPKFARTKTFPQAVAQRRTEATKTVIRRRDTTRPPLHKFTPAKGQSAWLRQLRNLLMTCNEKLARITKGIEVD